MQFEIRQAMWAGALLLLAAVAAGTAATNVVTVEVRDWQDGRDWLILQNDSIRWEHWEFNVPGVEAGHNDPTFITTTLNGVNVLTNQAWYPQWPEGMGSGAYSAPFSTLIPALPAGSLTSFRMEVIAARDAADLIQLPAANNGYTTIVELDDDPASSADWYDVRLIYECVPEPPTIRRPPVSQTAEAGRRVVLAVDAVGAPALTFKWFFNGTNAFSGTSTNSRLVLTNILFSQSGTYTVVVTNWLGAVTSAPVTLNVIAPVDRRLVPGVNLMAQAGTPTGLDYRDYLGPTENWETMATMTLSNSSQFYFDLSEPLPPQRSYRAWQSATLGVRPSLDLHLVPAITLTGNLGNSVRLDCINQFGPTDAWVTLDTVTLTNTSQLYFDTSALGQPQRLYRLVQVP